MLCDFSAGVKPVSFLNISPINMGVWTGPARVLEANRWHNGAGEPRIRLDYSRILSFYDTELFPDLQTARVGLSRWDHNLEDIAPKSIQTYHKTLDALLSDEWTDPKSGIDWKTLFVVVSQRYAERLELLQYILKGTSITLEKGVGAILTNAQRHISSMIMPFIVHSAYPRPPKADSQHGQIEWAAPIFKQCASAHTLYLDNDTTLFSKLTRSERLLLTAVKDVSKEICRVLVGIWAEGVNEGLMDNLDITNESDNGSRKDLLKSWRQRVAGLMGWLDWSYWATCRPACGYEVSATTRPSEQYLTWVTDRKHATCPHGLYSKPGHLAQFPPGPGIYHLSPFRPPSASLVMMMIGTAQSPDAFDA